MRILTKVAAVIGGASLALTVATTAGASTTTVKPAGTPSCGNSCFNLWNLQLGHFVTQNSYVGGDTGATGHVGTIVNMHTYGNGRPNGDFRALLDTTVGTTATPGTACGEGLLAPTSVFCINTQYASSAVIETQFTPFGNGSADLCVGLAPGSSQVSLQTCGMSNRTIWVSFYRDGAFGDTPFVNGSAVSFSNPNVLTLSQAKGTPQDKLTIAPLSQDNGVTSDLQEFGFNVGVTP